MALISLFCAVFRSFLFNFYLFHDLEEIAASYLDNVDYGKI